MALKEAGINLIAKDNLSRVYRDKDWLRENYCDRGLSLHECGKLAGCDKTTILNWLRRFGIPRRTYSETMKAAWARGTHDGVFQSPTPIEIAISEALDELGIMHVKQYRPEGCTYIYDEYLLAEGILLEVNGDYWHTREGMPERDALKGSWAREHGFIPVAIWEHEIKEYGAVSMIQLRVLGKG